MGGNRPGGYSRFSLHCRLCWPSLDFRGILDYLFYKKSKGRAPVKPAAGKVKVSHYATLTVISVIYALRTKKRNWGLGPFII
jgi:hypothetical protein